MATQEQTVQTRVAAGSRIADLLSFLKKEIVGNELLFTADHARRVVEELGFHDTMSVWNTLSRLEKGGQLIRKKKKRGKGISVSLNTSEPQAPTRRGKGSNTLTVPQLLSQLETEIASLENTIATREKQLTEKKTLYKQISTLARR